MLDPFHLIHFDPDPNPGGGDPPSGGDPDPDPGDPDPAPQEGTPAKPDGEQDDQRLKEARKEAAKYRTDLRNAQKKIEELEGASKTELEKATDAKAKSEERASTLESDNRNLRARIIGGTVGIDPAARGDAALLLDWSKIEDPTDDDQVESALRDLVKDRPYLLGNVRGGGDGGAGGTRDSSETDMNTLIRAGSGRG